MVRRKLADISNLPQNQRPAIQEEKLKSIETSTKECITQLQKVMLSIGFIIFMFGFSSCVVLFFLYGICDSGKHGFGEDVGTEKVSFYLGLFGLKLLCCGIIISDDTFP